MTDKEYEQKKRECWEEFCRANPSHNKSIFARKVFDFAFDRAYTLGKQFGISEQVDAEKAAERYADEIRIPASIPGALVPMFHDIAKSSYLQGAQDFLGKPIETITQEEIEDAAKDYAYDIDGSDWERQRARDGFVDGANFALGKQEEDAEDDKTLKVNRQLFCQLCADADDYINEHLEEEDSDYGYYQGRSDALHELYRGVRKDTEDTVISGWVARDESGDLYMYTCKPKKISNLGYWDGHVADVALSNNPFPDLTWDSDPIEVEIQIKRKKNG